jgi:tRNA nucleotidyltransferase (CCA-adding enzyme)
MDSSPQPDLSLLSPELRSLLAQSAQVADQRGWHIYLVGGVVRDLLYFSHKFSDELRNLSPLTSTEAGVRAVTPNFTDIDLVVDSYHQTSKAGTGVEVAQALQLLHPTARLEVHGDFQTAALSWHQDPLLGSLSVDIATARTESYPHPAANPVVATSSIYQDLQRRDFTINTLALRLTPEIMASSILGTPGVHSQNAAHQSNVGAQGFAPSNSNSQSSEVQSTLGAQGFAPSVCITNSLVLDFFGGWEDLQNKQVRVLHSQSFIDDPTRIYRAVRFAVRLGFQIESQTESYIRDSIASGVYEELRSTQPKLPALQNRLRTEIKYIFRAAYYQPALKLLGDLQALKCLHPNLELDSRLWQQVRLGDRLLKYLHQFLSQSSSPFLAQDLSPASLPNHPHYFPLPPDWLLRLEIIIASLPEGDRLVVANNLQLPTDSISRLQQLSLVESSIPPDSSQDLPTAVTNLAVSQLVERLKYYECSLLLLTAIRSSQNWRRQIWQYLTVFRRVRSPLDGHDLKNLGYPPGKQYKIILEALTTATLDGIITDYQSAVNFLETNFPLDTLFNP